MSDPVDRYAPTPGSTEIYVAAHNLAYTLLMQTRKAAEAGGPGPWVPAGPATVRIRIEAVDFHWAHETQFAVQMPPDRVTA